MKIKSGYLYFIKNDFFDKVQDSCLKINYEHTSRPHYFAFKDGEYDLFWAIPLSSKVDKYKKLIADRQERGKPTDGMMIVKIQGIEMALLLQDMFPVTNKYIDCQYVRNHQPMFIPSVKVNAEIFKKSRKVVGLLNKGIKLTPTQPDTIKIKNILLAEIKKDQLDIDEKEETVI